MKAIAFKEMSGAELGGKLKELKQEYFSLRFQHATGKLTDANKLNFMRKDIARCMTEIRARELKGIKIEEAPAEEPKKKAKKSVKTAESVTEAPKRARKKATVAEES